MDPSLTNIDAGRVAPVAALSADARALWAETDALLRDVGCDAETRAAAGWYAVAVAHPQAWLAESARAPESLRRVNLQT